MSKSINISDDLWFKSLAKARKLKKSLSSLIKEFLEKFLNEK